MVKMRMIHAYKMTDVPDHIAEEFDIQMRKMLDALAPVVVGVDANILLSAICHIHAAMITHYISDDVEEKKKATLISAKSLIKNVEFYAGIDIFDKEDKI